MMQSISILTGEPVQSESFNNPSRIISNQTHDELNQKVSETFVNFTEMAAHDYEKLRVFDLGGSGLKTALLCYDKNLGTMNWIESQAMLGMCPDDSEVDEWIRMRMRESIGQDLDVEISSGYSFGFSLAGLNKLRARALETSDMSTLFKIPSAKISCIDDGAAHLIASMNVLGSELPEGPIWNLSIGTGVGFGFTDCSHNVRNLYEFCSFFGHWPWGCIEPFSGEKVWISCGSKYGFDQIVADHGGLVDSDVFTEFTSRWKAYLEICVLKFSKEHYPDKDWGIPVAVVFTGGHIDHFGTHLADMLQERALEIPVFTGPKSAGLLGAGWNTVANSFKKIPLIEVIKSQDIKAVKQLLVQAIDIKQHDALGCSLLSTAIQIGNTEIVQLLIESGTPVNEPDFAFQTPLILAVRVNNIEIVKLLMGHGADVNAKDSWGQNALFFAKKSDNLAMEELFSAQNFNFLKG